ncbi:MAG: kelch repeat-containing protein, partial [Myxococcota bacterium]
TTNDLWSWDGEQWRLEEVEGTLPPSRYAHKMVYDSDRDRLVVFGGCTQRTCGTMLNDMWVLEAGRWQELSVSGGPSPRAGFGMTYSEALGGVVINGGCTSGWELDFDGIECRSTDLNSPSVTNTFLFDGSSWSTVASGFEDRGLHELLAIGTDLLSVGGCRYRDDDDNGRLCEAIRTTTCSPSQSAWFDVQSGRTGSAGAAVFDKSRNLLLFFGGVSGAGFGGGQFFDTGLLTWNWQGSCEDGGWNDRVNGDASEPVGFRSRPSSVYDDELERVVMILGNADISGDAIPGGEPTMQFRDLVWSDANRTSNDAPNREGMRWAYDSNREVFVGFWASGSSYDTYEWGGSLFSSFTE